MVRISECGNKEVEKRKEEKKSGREVIRDMLYLFATMGLTAVIVWLITYNTSGIQFSMDLVGIALVGYFIGGWSLVLYRNKRGREVKT